MGVEGFGNTDEGEVTPLLKPYCFAFSTGIPYDIAYGGAKRNTEVYIEKKITIRGEPLQLV